MRFMVSVLEPYAVERVRLGELRSVRQIEVDVARRSVHHYVGVCYGPGESKSLGSRDVALAAHYQVGRLDGDSAKLAGVTENRLRRSFLLCCECAGLRFLRIGRRASAND